MRALAHQSAGKWLLVLDNGAIGVAPEGAAFTNQHTVGLLRELLEAGIRPLYAAPGTSIEPNSNLMDQSLQASAIDIFIIGRGQSALPRLYALLRLVFRIARMDHVYIFFPGTYSLIIATFCWLFRKRYGLYIRGAAYDGSALHRMALRRAQFALTVSPLIEARAGNLCRSVATIRPMFDLEPRDALRRPERTTAPPLWKLLFVGRLETDKGIYELVSAARQLQANGLRFQLRLIGGGPLFRQLLDEQGAGRLDCIAVPGMIADRSLLMREYEAADIFISPSYHEGFPRTLYEAMMKGLPIITTMVGGIPGYMKAGQNCCAIEPKSAESIVTAVEAVTGNLSLLNAIALNGQRTVLDILRDHKRHSELLIERLAPHAV